jgi:hypothetical protein
VSDQTFGAHTRTELIELAEDFKAHRGRFAGSTLFDLLRSIAERPGQFSAEATEETPQATPASDRKVWGFGEAEAEPFYGSYETREEAVEGGRNFAALHDYPLFFIVRGTIHPPSAYLPHVDLFLEAMAAAAGDEVGEPAEDWPEPSPEATTELGVLLASWADCWLSCNFWTCDSETLEEIQIDKEDGAGE